MQRLPGKLNRKMERLSGKSVSNPGTGLSLMKDNRGWVTFGRKRRVYIPAGVQAVENYALKFFFWRPWQQMVCRWLLLVGCERVFGGSAKDTATIQTVGLLVQRLGAEPGNLLSDDQVLFAVQEGSPGPYQKLSVLVVKESGIPVLYAKQAVGPEADAMVEAESRWLLRLSAISALAGRVPLLLSHGKTTDERAFFATTVSSYLDTQSGFGDQHCQFLAALGSATVQWVEYAHSKESLFARSALKRLLPILGSKVHADLEAAQLEVGSALGSRKLPMVVAHRDFAPWNIRWHVSGIFVFDWEYAEEGATPLYDFFHFHLIQSALSRWGNLSSAPKDIEPIIVMAGDYLRETFPEVEWQQKDVRYMLLAYLVNLILFYVDSGKLFDSRHPVLSMYLNLVGDRKQWIQSII